MKNVGTNADVAGLKACSTWQHSRNQMWGGRPRPRRPPWSGVSCVRAGWPGGRPRARGPAPPNHRDARGDQDLV